MKANFWSAVMIIGVVHFSITMFSAIVSFSYGMNRFDAGFLDPKPIEFISDMVVNVLMYPAALLWNLPSIKGTLKSFELLVWLANSLIWAVVIVYTFKRIKSVT